MFFCLHFVTFFCQNMEEQKINKKQLHNLSNYPFCNLLFFMPATVLLNVCSFSCCESCFFAQLLEDQENSTKPWNRSSTRLFFERFGKKNILGIFFFSERGMAVFLLEISSQLFVKAKKQKIRQFKQLFVFTKKRRSVQTDEHHSIDAGFIKSFPLQTFETNIYMQ